MYIPGKTIDVFMLGKGQGHGRVAGNAGQR